jgi:hypothetical protein
MKKLLCLLIAFLMFVSCSTVHKTISSVKKTEDSVAVVTKDTSSLSTQVKTDDNFTAKGVDITIDFKDSTKSSQDTVKWTPVYVPKSSQPSDDEYMTDIIKDAVSSLPSTGQIPSSITIHIDSLTNTDSTSVIKDSTHGIEKSTVTVKTNTDTKDKIVSKSGLSFGTYAIIGLAVIILLAVFVIKKFIL